MISVDSSTEKIWIDAQYDARMKKTNLSEEVCKFVRNYHERASKPIEVISNFLPENFKLLERWEMKDLKKLTHEDLLVLRFALVDRGRESINAGSKI